MTASFDCEGTLAARISLYNFIVHLPEIPAYSASVAIEYESIVDQLAALHLNDLSKYRLRETDLQNYARPTPQHFDHKGRQITKFPENPPDLRYPRHVLISIAHSLQMWLDSVCGSVVEAGVKASIADSVPGTVINFSPMQIQSNVTMATAIAQTVAPNDLQTLLLVLSALGLTPEGVSAAEKAIEQDMVEGHPRFGDAVRDFMGDVLTSAMGNAGGTVMLTAAANAPAIIEAFRRFFQ